MSLGWSLAAVPFLIALNAFFVAGEYAVVAARATHIDNLRRRKHTTAANALERLKSHSAAAIGTIQVCITATNLVLGWVGEPAITTALNKVAGPALDLLPDGGKRAISLILSFTVVTLLTVVFGELLPKAMTLRYVEPIAIATSPLVAWLLPIVRPLVKLMNFMANLVTRPLGLGRVDDILDERITTDEIRVMTTEAAEDGVLTGRERALILNTLALGARTARQIMVPRVKVQYLDLQRSMQENLAIMGERLHSRLPLCDGGLDQVAGLVHTKEFLTAYQFGGDVSVLSLIARPAVFAPEIMPLDQLLQVFHDKKTQFVFLVDEYGGLAGIVTLRDVVDELLGTGSESLAPGASTRRFVVPGATPVHELAQRLGRDGWPSSDAAATLNGLLLDRFGRVPRVGEQTEIDGVALRVLEADKKIVRRVEVRAEEMKTERGDGSAKKD